MISLAKALKRGMRHAVEEQLRAAGVDVTELEAASPGDWEPVARKLVEKLEAENVG